MLGLEVNPGDIHAQILLPCITFAWITVALSHDSLREALFFWCENFKPHFTRVCFLTRGGGKMPFHSHNLLFLLIPGQACRMESHSHLCRLVSTKRWGWSIAGYYTVQVMVLGLRAPFFLSTDNCVPLGELPVSTSELMYQQDRGLVGIKGETLGRGSANGDVRENLL